MMTPGPLYVKYYVDLFDSDRARREVQVMDRLTSSAFHASTRGRILALLRGGHRTVDELATELGLTDNAVRPHLLALERDGLIRSSGFRRPGGAGKPAVVYDLHPDAEPLLSRAYAPVLGALLEVLTETLSTRDAHKVLRETGRRLAAAHGGAASGNLKARAEAAAAVLDALGGSVTVETHRRGVTLRGVACPLASAVRRSPNICAAVETLVSEISGAEVEEKCERADRPHCCFDLRAG
jgi:predicted ArsR family transcriptional regulator